MAIERAVVKGTILGVVQSRAIFTADVVPSGGDTNTLLWTTYVQSIYTPARNVWGGGVVTQTMELYTLTGGSYVTYDEVSFPNTGGGTADHLPNAVAWVLLGKAAGLRHVGRKFFGPPDEDHCGSNTLVTAVAANVAAALLAYITPFTGLGGGVITPGVVDKNGTFHPFVGGVVSSLLGSMRRRKPGNGF